MIKIREKVVSAGGVDFVITAKTKPATKDGAFGRYNTNISIMDSSTNSIIVTYPDVEHGDLKDTLVKAEEYIKDYAKPDEPKKPQKSESDLIFDELDYL